MAENRADKENPFMSSADNNILSHPAEPPVRWFVATFLDAKYLLEWLKDINAQRLASTDLPVITTFYPYDFLSERTPRPSQENDNEEEAVFRIFQHLIFLRARYGDLRSLVNHEDNVFPINLRFYLDVEGHPATVPDAMMETFISACANHRGYFRLVPPISSIEANDRVRIEEGPFAGQEATVTHVRKSRKEITLELTIPLINGAVNILLPNVQRHQIAILDYDASDAIRPHFIEYAQNHLLTILSNRIKRVQDPAINSKDADMLNRLYRYRGHEVEGEAAATHFLALMLICAHLCKDTTGEAELRAKALQQLEAINARPESRAATDTRTYLWIALYISTAETDYSRLAKQYVKDHDPKSRPLRRFVSLIRKGRKV